MKEKLFKLIESIAAKDGIEITDSTNLLEDLSFDSLKLIKLLIKVEEQFGIEIDFDEFDISVLNSAGTFLQYIEKEPVL